VDGETAALASTVAATLVTLLTTDAWTGAKNEIVAVWQRFRPAHADVVEADLTQARDEAVAGDKAVVRTLTAEWESRLGRLIAASPDAAAELRLLNDRLLEQQPTIIQKAKASGHGTVIQVGRDARIGDVMLEERPIQVQRASATDAAVIIQVGRDLYVSDPALSALWVPGETKPGECPFPGLDAFGPGQARWFFGRQKLTGDLLQVLDEIGPGLVLVVGPSGAGKSSLLGAGLLAAIGEGRLPEADSWPRLMITPGAHPARTLHDALATASGQGQAAGTIIVVDQLEEIFTACDDEDERAEFLDALAATGGYVVAGLRADFYDRATGYPVLRAAMQSRQLVLGAMTPAEVRDAILLPARSVGLTLDDGLVERLLRDLGVDETGGYEAGRLPLLAHALRATWQRRSGDRLTVDGYEATGGIHGAIAKTAEDVYARLDEAGQDAARRLFLSLVRIGDGEATTDTRRRVSTESLDAPREVLDAFTAARLLTSGGQTVEITHEALIRRWPRLREWIDEDRAVNLVRQGVEEAAAVWDHEGRDPAGLYGGVRLAAARAWTADPGHQRELSSPASDFLTASDRRRRRGVRRRNEIIAALTALVVALGCLTGYAFNQRATAEAQRAQAVAENRISESGVLAAQSAAAFSTNDPETGMEFAIAADRLEPRSLQSSNALLDAQSSRFITRLEDLDDPTAAYASSVAYDPRGGLIATSTFTGYVRLWSVPSHKLLWEQQPDGAGRVIHDVAFTPNGSTLVSTEPDGVRLWRVASPGRLVSIALLGTSAGISSLAISPDGQTIAAGDTKGRIWLWNVGHHALTGILAPGIGAVPSLAFVPGGNMLAITGDNGSVQLWNVARRSLITAVRGTVPNPFVSTLAVSPNGSLLAFAAPKDTIDLWSIASHRLEATPLSAGPNAPDTLAFSPDSTLLASGDVDGGVKLWDVYDQPALLDTLNGHSNGVNQVAFSPDGDTLASASDDTTVALWNVLGDTLDSRAQYSIAVRFSPDGRLLAVGSNVDNVADIVLYSMPARKKIATLEHAVPGTDTVSTITFSPNGQILAAALEDPANTVQLWDVASHRLIGEIETRLSATTEIRSMAFSPDGSLLAVSSLRSPTVQLWSTTRWTLVSTINASLYTNGLDGSLFGVWGLAFSPDGRLLAVAGSDGITRLFSMPRHQVTELCAEEDETMSVAFSPDGHTLATGESDGNVYLWPVHPENKQYYAIDSASLVDSDQSLNNVAFGSGGNTVIAAGYDGSVRIWNVQNPALAARIPASSAIIRSMTYSQALGIIVTTDGTVTRVWQTNTSQMAAGICRQLGAPVSLRIWDDYVQEYPYIKIC